MTKEHLRYEYGMSVAEFERMIVAQDGRCLVCGLVPKPTKISKTGFVVDHCHKSDKVRALLCQRCNSGLGMFCDDIKLLRRAIAYLNGDMRQTPVKAQTEHIKVFRRHDHLDYQSVKAR
jgi:hypothetical protein